MPRKRDVVKARAPVPRIQENSRLMRTHESMIDFISGRDSGGSLFDVLGPAFLGYNFLRPLEDDLIYSDSDDYEDDDDDDDDDEGYDHRYHHAAKQPLRPHPQIKQLTDEEADKIAKELREEGRVKGKTEKNKRKKMRKKEKKRLEKENAIKDNVSEEGGQGKSDVSENQEKESTMIENNAEAKELVTNECSKSENVSEEAGCDKHSDNKEEIPVKAKKKKDEGQKNLDLDNSSVSTAKSGPEEACDQKPAKERKEKKKVQQPEEEKPKAAEKPEAPKNKDEKQKGSTEKIVTSATEDYAKRSIELANMGNRLAASGQYEVAVRCFTDAIKFNPREYKLFGNRSLCYERMQQYENALRDADLAVSMEPNWIKGLFRKGKALCGLKRYYEASLVYKEVLKLESTSPEALQELKRAQTLHLMEMGFTWAQSSEALKTHATLEEAVEALFASESNSSPADVGANNTTRDQPEMPEEKEQEDDDDDDGGEWTVRQPSRPRMQHINVSDAFNQCRSKSQSPTPRSRNSVKPELFSVWVGFLAPAVTYTRLHELFSRTGTIYSIKMLLEHQCAFVNYTNKEDCERAIQCINGMVVEGAPLTVRYPYKNHNESGASTYKKECFFWRTTGCTRSDCTYRHVPENKNIDRDKFTSRLGYMSHAGNQK